MMQPNRQYALRLHCVMKHVLVLLSLLCLPLTSTSQAQDVSTSLSNWAGTWQGHLTNLPARAGTKPVDVMMEIGEFPSEAGACAMWRTTYAEEGVVRQVKDYRLCRGKEPNDLVVDEGDGIKLATRWIGDVLVTPFKYNDTLLITTMRLRGDVLEQEILTMPDKPAIDGIQSMIPRGIQRLVFRRAEASSK